MKNNLFYLTLALTTYGALQAMQPPQQYDFTRPEDVQRRAREDHLDLSIFDAGAIAYVHLLSPLGLTNPEDLMRTAGENNLAPIGLDEARSIIYTTYLGGLTNPLEIMKKAKELGIPLTFEDAQNIARKEWFIETFFGWTRPEDIRTQALAMGYPMTPKEASRVAVNLFERRIARAPEPVQANL